ncbi:hypothetical protein E2C01_019388 [Portunus trituberculatus]|uniref:Uncharacterized protein n=1 Tax=Portunus trituberculatus TaxID=210409 RepID=A0A5B7DX24_PORTR|nr:hypothetical protein [Portunus trituberculatus]
MNFGFNILYKDRPKVRITYNHIHFSEFSGFEFAGRGTERSSFTVIGWFPASVLSLALLDLDSRFFNNIRAASCSEMASMNAWREGDKVAFRLLGTPPLQDNLDSVASQEAEKEGDKEEEPVCSLDIKTLRECLGGIEKALETLKERDLNSAWSSKVAHNVEKSVKIYQEIYDEKARKNKQSSIYDDVLSSSAHSAEDE